MSEEKIDRVELDNKHEKENLTGTAFSVGVVGAVILITYVLLYGLYMARV